ncbi:MAG: LysE family translocator [Pseudomonadota bacterium]
MTAEVWLTYVVACLVLTVIPGPSVVLVLNHTLIRGWQSGLASVGGTVLGGLVVIPASYLGLGAILTVSANAFVVMKWIGIVYLMWLGATQCLDATSSRRIDQPRTATQNSFVAGLVIGVMNPKTVVFYAAFMAQFISPTSPLFPQFLILLGTSLATIVVILPAYVFLASQVRRVLLRPHSKRVIEFCGGVSLMGGAVWLAAKD